MKWYDDLMNKDEDEYNSYLEEEFFKRTGKTIKIKDGAKGPFAFKDFTLEDHDVYQEILTQGIDHIEKSNKRLAIVGILVVSILTLSAIMYAIIRTPEAFIINIMLGVLMTYIFYRENRAWKKPKIK